ncbi:MAG: hypothetical protein ACYS8Z_03660 [Planctomycetota bacterium]|jgi:hypothetical protein
MAEAKNFCIGCFSILLLVFCGGAYSESGGSEGWPEKLGKSKQYRLEYGYVYARTKSAAVAANKLLAEVSKEIGPAGRKEAVKGLVIVTDKKGENLAILKKMIELVEGVDDPEFDKKTQEVRESLEDVRKQVEEVGIDLELAASLAPMEVEPAALPKLVDGISEELAAELDFCVIMPTKGNTKYVIKKATAGYMKKNKVGLLQRIMLLPFMPFVQNKAVGQTRKIQRFAIFNLLLDKQYDLTEKEKEERTRAYRERNGLGEEEAEERPEAKAEDRSNSN